MSIEIMTRVWRDSKQTECSRLLLLLALADHCDPDGICFPGIAHLARKIRKTERHVRRLLRDLEKDGEVYTSINRGPHLANLYLVTVGFTQDEIKATLVTRLKVSKESANDLAAMLLTPDAGVPLTPASITPDTGVLPPLTPASITPDTGVPLTIINHHINHQKSSLSTDANSTSTETDPDFPVPTKKFPSYVPGPGKVVACEDPDTGEEVGELNWRFPQTQVQHQAFNVTGRIRFGSKAEFNKLRRIERMLDSGEMPYKWWENRIYNAGQHRWSFPKLLKYTLNVDNMREWERMNK